MNIKNKKSSFNFKTTITIVLFGVAILLILYFFQNFYLNHYYEVYKINQVETIAKEISASDDLNYYFSKISNERDVCIQYITKIGTVLYNENMKGCLLNNPNQNTSNLMESMYQSDKDIIFYKITNPRYNTKSFLFGKRIGENYVFINSQLESLDETNKIIRNQLIYLLIIVIVLSCIIASLVSRSITKPIFDITKRARKMAKGDLKVTFKPSKISEIDELSETLNYAMQEMVKTDDYRRDLMANVGHDLKTPLTLIKSYAEMIRDISYKDPKKRTEHLNVIINEANRLNELVNDITDLSKLESSAEKLNIETYDVVKEIKEIISKFKILELTENYNFVYTGPSEAFIKADKKKMNQVIYNLINNAINYTGQDAKIFINIIKQKNDIQVEIIDTGKGIDDETIKHVWNRYYKTEKNHKRNKTGTGLGLSIVREILEAHKFKYGVKSTLGKGTNFYFIATLGKIKEKDKNTLKKK